MSWCSSRFTPGRMQAGPPRVLLCGFLFLGDTSSPSPSSRAKQHRSVSRAGSSISRCSNSPGGGGGGGGGTGGGASYTEKATTRLQCRKLAKFIKMTEYLLIDALMSFIRASTNRFADTLVRSSRPPLALLFSLSLALRSAYFSARFLCG